jgi:hypothetical protein
MRSGSWHLLVSVSFWAAVAGCAPREPAPKIALADRPPVSADNLSAVQVDNEMLEVPAGTIRVVTVSRGLLDAMSRSESLDEFDNAAKLLFYMGSDDGWDYYLLAHHTFSRFYRVAGLQNEQDERMPLTSDSTGWRELKPISRAKAQSRPTTSQP